MSNQSSLSDTSMFPRHRPSGLTPQVRDDLLADIRLGHSDRSACRHNAVPYGTFKRWLGLGRIETSAPEYRDLWAQVTRARADRIHKLLGYAEKHAENDPRTTLHLLAVYDPFYAGSAQQQRLKVQVSGSVEHVHKLGKPQQDQDYRRIVDYLLRPELEEPTVEADFTEVQSDGQLPE